MESSQRIQPSDIPEYPRLRSDCANAQSDFSLGYSAEISAHAPAM